MGQYILGLSIFNILIIGAICGNHQQSFLSKLWLTLGRIERSPLARSMQITLSILSGEEIKSIIELQALGWKRNIRNILTEANQGLEVMCPMSSRREISGWRLITCVKSCIVGRMLDEIKRLHQARDLIQKKTAPTDRGQGLLPVNPSLHLHAQIRRRGKVEGKVRAHPLGTWEMMR